MLEYALVWKDGLVRLDRWRSGAIVLTGTKNVDEEKRVAEGTQLWRCLSPLLRRNGGGD